MDATFWSLLLAAAGVALTHTLLGPDHYLPFVMLARARRWSRSKAVAVTAACGVAHVVSSIGLGLVGVAIGVGLGQLQRWESMRGSLAAWMLVAFGVAYASWGIRMAVRRRRGLEPHAHAEGVHLHHHGNLPHEHGAAVRGGAGFWPMLAIFVLGPCEPLVPLFVLPASDGRWALAAWTALVFGVVTIAAMIGMVVVGIAGIAPLASPGLQRWSHALAGGVIAASGLAILFLGL